MLIRFVPSSVKSQTIISPILIGGFTEILAISSIAKKILSFFIGLSVLTGKSAKRWLFILTVEVKVLRGSAISEKTYCFPLIQLLPRIARVDVFTVI